MTIDQKRERCFKILIPEVLKLLHELHIFEAERAQKVMQELRTRSREDFTSRGKMDLNEEIFLEMVVKVVEAIINYQDFIGLCNTIKERIPENSIKFVDKDSSGENMAEKFDAAIKTISESQEKEITPDVQAALKTIVIFVANSESAIHKFNEVN